MGSVQDGTAIPPSRRTAGGGGGGGGVVAGVDAGGSHTTVVIADRSLVALARASGPPGAVSDETMDRAAAVIRATLTQAVRDASVDGRPAALVVGAAGAGRTSERKALLAALDGCADKVDVTTDGAIALESAFGGGPGIVVLAGTGSIAYARNAAGAVWRVGGLGWQLGDEGSGYAVGRAALSAVGKALDGRGRGTELTEPVIAAAGCSSLEDLVGWARSATRERIATLAPIACEIAGGGDEVARRIVDEAAAELAGHVRSLRARFPRSASVQVAAAGGLLQRNAVLRAALAAKLSALGGVTLVETDVDPAMGAVRLGLRLLGG